jgi:hypothetical protein
MASFPKPITVTGMQENSTTYIEVDLAARIWGSLDAELKVWKSGAPIGKPDTDTSLTISNCILSADKTTLTGTTHVFFISPTISLVMAPTKLTVAITNAWTMNNTYVIDIGEGEYKIITDFITACGFPAMATS